MYFYQVLLRPARLLGQSIMILLDPGVDQTLGPQGSQSQVGGGGGSISGGAALSIRSNNMLALAILRLMSMTSVFLSHLHHPSPGPRGLTYPR